MYRRLEEVPAEQCGEDAAPEEVCNCVCKTERSADEEPQPEAVFAATQLAVDFDING